MVDEFLHLLAAGLAEGLGATKGGGVALDFGRRRACVGESADKGGRAVVVDHRRFRSRRHWNRSWGKELR